MVRFITFVNFVLIFSGLSAALPLLCNINSFPLFEYGIRIIGGEEVYPHSYPFQVGLRINYNSFCGGVLISPNYVLTAAHCGEVIDSVTVILGAHEIKNEDEPTRLTVTGRRVILHPGFNMTNLRNDIALIELDETIILNGYIQLAQLPSYSDRNRTYSDEKLTAIGWGLTHDQYNPSYLDISPVLRSVDVDVVVLEECKRFFFDREENTSYVNSNHICISGYKNRGTCKGDSGGPLLDSHHAVVGLTSFGTDLCETCTPSVFTRIDAYLDWIISNSDVAVQ